MKRGGITQSFEYGLADFAALDPRCRNFVQQYPAHDVVFVSHRDGSTAIKLQRSTS
jgi:hypothetical protein